jgi:hypothetical protein
LTQSQYKGKSNLIYTFAIFLSFEYNFVIERDIWVIIAVFSRGTLALLIHNIFYVFVYSYEHFLASIDLQNAVFAVYVVFVNRLCCIVNVCYLMSCGHHVYHFID